MLFLLIILKKKARKKDLVESSEYVEMFWISE